MSRKSIKDLALSVIVFGAGFAAVVGLTPRIEASRPSLPAGYQDSDLTIRGGEMRGYLFGAEGLLADWYWARTLQYIGDKLVASGQGVGIKSIKPLNPRLLYPMLDQASSLDPRFMTLYSYGANLLPEVDPEQAIKLIDKGIGSNPDEWKLYHYRGYIYWQLRDYRKAAESYEAGSQIPKAPPWMKLMAVNMATKGGGRETARAVYTEMLNAATDDQTREAMKLKLLNLDSLDERDAIRQALQIFRTRTGRCTANWRELLPILRTVKMPNDTGFRIDRSGDVIDPTGAPYVLETEKCDVRIDFERSKLGIDYEELPAAGEP